MSDTPERLWDAAELERMRRMTPEERFAEMCALSSALIRETQRETFARFADPINGKVAWVREQYGDERLTAGFERALREREKQKQHERASAEAQG